jgi:hypothetical protein
MLLVERLKRCLPRSMSFAQIQRCPRLTQRGQPRAPQKFVSRLANSSALPIDFSSISRDLRA